MKKVLYILNDCMRKFTYERVTGLYHAFARMEEPTALYIVRSDGYSAFAPEHNCGEYNIFRLPDYRDFDGILLDINSVFTTGTDAFATESAHYAVRAAAESGKPVISIASDIEGFYYVGIDNYHTMQSVIRYLHQDRGLRDFWFVMGPEDNYENRSRLRGLRDYCEENKLPCGEERFYAESFMMECGIHGFEQLYARHGARLPQAVICVSDYVALGVCHAAEQAGYAIPDDLMVTGFDNDDVSATLSPSITTVDQNCPRMIETCAETMLRLWRGEAVSHRIFTPAELVLRESTRDYIPAGSTKKRIRDYAGRGFSAVDFSYRLSVMQYQLPGCKSIEEIGNALVHCLSRLGCTGICIILDSDLLNGGCALRFDGHIGQLRDLADGMPTQGYSDNMELIFSWDAKKGTQFVRQKVGRTFSTLAQSDVQENTLLAPLHFMQYTVGYLVLQSCFELIRIKGVSTVVNTLTMALRNYFSKKSLASMNHLLSGISMKDELTGLYNRLGYHDLAYPLFRELSKNGGRLGILFLDMDRLKHINDFCGHAAGDKAIRSAANAILHNVPEDAISIRYGGDEFLILIPSAGQESILQILGAISAALPLEAKLLGAPELFGLSAGWIISDPNETKALDQYVQEADARMYKEKKSKRRQRID